MTKYDNDELYLLVDFLEEQLDIMKDNSAPAEDEYCMERTIEIVKSLIKE